MTHRLMRGHASAMLMAALLWVHGGAVSASEHATALSEAVNSEARSQANRDRDVHRRPAESLEFWGLAPGMSVLEVQPGAGWWTEILAPYTRATGGRLSVTGVDMENPELTDEMRARRGRQIDALAARADTWGEVAVINWGQSAAAPAADSFDFALVSRAVHGWMRGDGVAEKFLADLLVALKPGGILAIEQHRADPGEQDPAAPRGYVTEAHVIELAEQAGFQLDARSELNANPRDTKDHPFGVWTLPPAGFTVPYGSGREPDPDFDRAPYDAIGESDRMTLRFVKP